MLKLEAKRSTNVSMPLDDVRVVSLEQYGAGPFATLHLAELGAEIIRIEQWPDGDVGRHVPPYRQHNDSLFFQSLNRSKKSVCLNMQVEAGRRVFEDLVRCSNAVFSNLRGDVPPRLGITYKDLAEINPAVVCCSLSGYGMTGPRAPHPGFDYMVQGLAGWMSITGEPDGPPSKTGLSAVDFSSGFAAALALMAGIHSSQRTGKGMDCDISLFEVAASMMNYLVTWVGTREHDAVRVERSGHPTIVPFQNFPTADGWIVAGGSKEKFWTRLTQAIERPDLSEDPRFLTFEDRLENKAILVDELDSTFSQRSTAYWLSRLQEYGVPCAPINSVAEAIEDPHLKARDAIFSLNHRDWGEVLHVASPIRVGDTPHKRQSAPALGSDTRSVLSMILGYEEYQIEKLARDQVVAGPDLPIPN